ncbi:RloB family protein [Lactiplantibacillus plantarum]|uniref:RloB family protein n=1 Tax=Lactiplantibacillus plantarum TaxID=1590 RepID=UPI0026498E81|nr:RloB family protein [Lactiplantibacillus plantarum]WGS68714.1 RloB family protein [Lactiplantibacillus plantarum]
MSRTRNKRKLKPKIIFLVEGKSEKVFFEMLAQKYKLTASKVVKILDGTGHDFVDKAKSKLTDPQLKADNKTKVFVIFDNDSNLSDVYSREKSNINELFSKAQKVTKVESCDLVISNICFEVWLLAHFQKMTPGLKSTKWLNQKLGQYLGEEYIKGDSSQIEKILDDDKVFTAIKNTEKISSINCTCQSTNIGVVVSSVIKEL